MKKILSLTVSVLLIFSMFSTFTQLDVKAQETTWNTNPTPLPAPTFRHCSIVHNGKIYLLGTYGGGGQESPKVYYADINSDGTVGSWHETTSLPEWREYAAAVVWNDFVYVIGGAGPAWGGRSEQYTVYFALINPDGTIGEWGTTAQLPERISGFGAVVWNGRIYVAGGWNGYGRQDEVYFATINEADGSISNWQTTTPLPRPLNGMSALAYESTVFIIGGTYANEAQSSVYYTRFDETDGSLGEWGSTTSLPEGRTKGGCALIEDKIYVVGGRGGREGVDETPKDTVYEAAIDADGVGSWVEIESLPESRSEHSLVTLNGRIYVIGGRDLESNPRDTIYYSNELAYQPEKLADGNFIRCITIDSDNVYFTEYGTGDYPLQYDGNVKKVPIFGGGVDVLVDGDNTPWRITVDSEDVYYIAHDVGRIMKVSKDGGATEILAGGLNHPWDLAVDSDYVYFTERDSGYIKRVPKSGGVTETLASANRPNGIAIDSNYVYFTERDAGNIKKVSLTGGAVETIASGLNSMLFSITVDSDYVYFIEKNSNGRVGKVPKDGGSVTILASDQNAPFFAETDPDYVYYTEAGAGNVKRVAKSGGSVETLASGFDNPEGIAVDFNYVYFSDYNGVYRRARVQPVEYNVHLLFDDFDIEQDGILTTYFRVTRWNGHSEIPENGISFQIVTSLGDGTLTSEPYLGIDGIAYTSYDLSSFLEDTFEILVLPSLHNDIPVNPPPENPVLYNLGSRTSEMVFGTAHSFSAAAIARVEGEYGEEFTVTNDGSEVLDVVYSQYGKAGVGFEFNLFKAKLGVIKVEGGISATTGVSSGVDWEFTGLDNPTQSQLIKNCITRWILTNVIALNFPQPLDLLARGARYLIDSENKKLSIDDYNSLVEADGYVEASGELEASIGITSKHGGSKALGTLAYAGVGGELELRVSMNIYNPSKVGFLGEFSFDSCIGAGLGLHMGFLGVDGGFSSIRRFSTKIGVELIYEDDQVSVIQLNFEIEVPRDLYDLLSFAGLAIPLQDLTIPSELSSARFCLQYSLPTEKLTQSVTEYLLALTKGEVEYDALWNVIYDSIIDSRIPYSVRLESETDISIELGLSIDGISAEIGWTYYERNNFLIERGFFYNLREWPIEQHTTFAGSIGSVQFIVDNWIYSGEEPQPSGTVVELEEAERHLYPHIYDGEGKHVGLDYITGQIEIEIAGAYYYDNGDGMIAIVLPPETREFIIKVDGTYAEESIENYDLMISFLSLVHADQTQFTAEIAQGETHDYPIGISSTGEIVIWEYTFKDTRRDTVLKISTDDKYFQFIAPAKEFPIKEAHKMKVCRHSILIWHRDDEIELVTIAINTRIDFCFAYAKDMQTRDRYLLIDKPGIE